MADDLFSASDAATPAWRRLDADARARVHGLGPVLLLADHLDATLALAEDLTHAAVKLPEIAAASTTAVIERRNALFARFAQDVRALELGLQSRVVQARKRAVAIEVSHTQFQLLIRSFVGGTALLSDVIEAEARGQGLLRSDTVLAGPEALRFLRLRGVVDADVRSLDDIAMLAVTEAYPVAGVIEVGPLMDMIAAFLDALDTAFDLYGPALARAGDHDGG